MKAVHSPTSMSLLNFPQKERPTGILMGLLAENIQRSGSVKQKEETVLGAVIHC